MADLAGSSRGDCPDRYCIKPANHGGDHLDGRNIFVETGPRPVPTFEPLVKAADRWYQMGPRWGCARFGRTGWRRWEVVRDGRGVGGYLTPVGAWLGLRRWEREEGRHA